MGARLAERSLENIDSILTYDQREFYNTNNSKIQDISTEHFFRYNGLDLLVTDKAGFSQLLCNICTIAIINAPWLT